MKAIRKAVSLVLVLILLTGIIPISVNAEVRNYNDSRVTLAGTNDVRFSDGQAVTVDGVTYDGQDYRTWLQYDPRWASLPLGSGSSVGEEGCTVTAVTKLIIQSGLASPTELNPGILTRYLNQNNGFDGSLLQWSVVSKFCSEVLGKDFSFDESSCLWFRGTSGTRSLKADQTMYEDIITQLQNGYHLVVWVGNGSTGGSHWIAIDEVATLAADNLSGERNVYVMDSWRYAKENRYLLTLKFYITDNYDNAPNGEFFRITAYKTDLSDTDNVNYKEYDTDFVGYQDYGYTYRNWSRYDSRWATTVLDEPTTNTAEYVGEWGQALLALTKTLIESGAIPETTTPNDVLTELKSKSLIGTANGNISWTSLDNYSDLITAAGTATNSDINTYNTIAAGIRSGKHYIIKFNKDGDSEHAWSAIDEARTLASVDTVYLFSSGQDLAKNGGGFTFSDANASLGNVGVSSLRYLQTAAPSYYKLNFTGTNASAMTASYTIGSDTITVANGGYVPAGTEVILTAVPDTGYSGINWTAGGSTGTPNGRSYTVTVDEDTTVTAAGVAGTYNISYTTQTDSCGFKYGTIPSTATYGSPATFTVTPATSGYTVKVSCGDVTLTDNGDNTYTIPSMPAKDVKIDVTATYSTYTVYLDANGTDNNNAFDNDGVVWYAYTWTGNSGDEYDCQWIKANATKTASGYYQFDNIRDRVIFVRMNKDKESLLDKTKTLGDMIDAYKNDGDDRLVWNQTEDMNAGAEALYTITAWENDNKKLDVDSQYKFIYLYTRYDELRYGEGSYYAYTWKGEDKAWLKPISEEKGILRFAGVKDNVIFVKKATTDTNLSFDDNIGQTDDLTVAADSNDMYVLQSIKDQKGYWGNRDGVDLDYSLWARDDSRWEKLPLAESTKEKTGEYFLAQAITKLAIQAGLKNADDFDVNNVAWGAYTTSGNEGVIDNVKTKTAAGLTAYTGNDLLTTEEGIYRQVVGCYHMALKISNTKSGASTKNEWVAVDEAKTLETGEVWVWRSKYSGDDASLNSCTLKSVLQEAGQSAPAEIKAYKGGTTPYITRDYDYRRWSRYDGRWVDKSVGNYENMDTNGACIIAISKMFVQAGVLSDDYDNDGVYDANSFNREARTGDFSPEDLRNYLASLGVSDSSNTAGLMTDGSVYWAKVNGFVNNTLEFATTNSANGVIYLQFDQSDAEVIGVSGYGRKASWSAMKSEMTSKNITESTAYICSDENDKIMKALLQGYHMLIEVPSKGGGTVTWVVVDEQKSLETGTIYVMDSEPHIDTNADTTLVDDYKYFYRIVGYKGATVPLPHEYTTPDGETMISPHLEPSVYYDTETAKDGQSDCYRILYNSDAYLTVQVGGAVVGKTYVMTVDNQTYEVPATADNTKNGILTYTFDGTAENVTNKTTIPLNDDVTNTELTKTLTVKCKYEKDGTVTYSNTVTGTMYYKMYAVYEFKYRPRRGGEEATSTIRVPCEYQFLDSNSPTADRAIIAAHIPTDTDVRIYKELIDWGKAGISTAKYITTVNAKDPIDPNQPAQYPEIFTLTYYYYDTNGLLTQSGTVKDVAYNTQTVDLRDSGVLDNKPADTSDDAVFLGWYEATLESDDLVIGDRCLSTLERFGMVITRNTMIAPRFGAKTTSSDWSAYIDENTVTVEKSDDANGGHMYADFLVRYLNGSGTDVAVPDDAVYGVLFIYSPDASANTSSKSAATLKAYATHSGLLSGAVGNTKDDNGMLVKVANAKAEALSELNRVSIAVQNSYHNFKGCHYTAYAYITYTDSQTGAKITSLSSPVTGNFPE